MTPSHRQHGALWDRALDLWDEVLAPWLSLAFVFAALLASISLLGGCWARERTPCGQANATQCNARGEVQVCIAGAGWVVFNYCDARAADGSQQVCCFGRDERVHFEGFTCLPRAACLRPSPYEVSR